MTNFRGKTTLITGAASGIGRATALAFANSGAKVVVSDIDEGGAEATVGLIKEMGGEAVFIRADVSNKTDVERLIEETLAAYKTLDIGINNAGIGGPFEPVADYPDKHWDRVIAVNQTGVFYCMKEELKVMKPKGSGVIVNVSSIAGFKGLPNTCAYVASKHAVLGLTKTAAVEYARYNIRVNAVCPVFTHSKMLDQLKDANPGMMEKLKKGIPLRRFGQPEDIADAILWLCADSSSFVTGLCLPMDGGFLA